MQHLTKIRYPG